MVRELLASGEDVNEVNPWEWIPDGETECVLNILRAVSLFDCVGFPET